MIRQPNQSHTTRPRCDENNTLFKNYHSIAHFLKYIKCLNNSLNVIYDKNGVRK
jgi:hypothetical protein